jgi:monoglucosyldiacylglycerol epimerase
MLVFMTSQIWPILSIALASIVWVEIIRDLYHGLAHIWAPVYRLHVWHHKVFRPDLSVANTEIYRQAHWYNDVPEALVMLICSLLPWLLVRALNWDFAWIGLAGSVYTLSFLLTAIARGLGVPHVDELTDLTHRPGPFDSNPGHWFVNRTYHWRHHFDDQNAYFCGTLTLIDRLLGTAVSLKGKRVAVTGASGALGKALLKQLYIAGAKPIALSSSDSTIVLDLPSGQVNLETINWKVGQENQLQDLLSKVDILVLNHGVNVHKARDAEAIEKSFQINSFSQWRLMELFLSTIKTNRDIACKELWVNTSEAEVSPAMSPLYELSKRTIGDLVTLRRLDAPCVVRKLILGPFKSELNPVGVMSAPWVASVIVNLVRRDFRDVIVTINPITYFLFPIREFLVSNYFRLTTRAR